MKQSYKVLAVILAGTAVLMALKVSQQKAQPETMSLVPMMRLLLSDMYTIDEGIYTENFEMIEKGGTAVSDHPVMTEDDKKLVKSALGEDMKKFVNFDMIVHHHADSIAAAARNEKMSEVLRHYRIVQQGCVDCHTGFRTQIIEARANN